MHMTLSFYPSQDSSLLKSRIGKSAYQLTTLLDAGLPVPKGFIISPATYQAFLSYGNLEGKIKMLLARCNFSEVSDIARVSKNIKRLILGAPMPAGVASSLLAATVKLGENQVMLTPSPLDSSKASLIEGRLYNLRGEANILLGVRQIWAAQFSPESLYHIYTLPEQEFPSLAVCVQVQPEAYVSGIIWTSQTRLKRACEVKAVFGEGAYEYKLQGADTYWIDKESGSLLESEASIQTIKYVWKSGELSKVQVPVKIQKKSKVPSNLCSKLGELAKQIQQKLFYPQEVGFVFDGKSIFVMNVQTKTSLDFALQNTGSLTSPIEKKALVTGVGVTPGIITGMVRVVRGVHDLQVGAGDILVARSLSHINPSALKMVKGIIVEESPEPSSYMSLASRGITFLAQATGAIQTLVSGSFITLHSPRGEVLAGGYKTVETQAPVEKTHSATLVGQTLELGTPLRIQPGSHRGHVLLSPKRLIQEIGIHPLELLPGRGRHLLTTRLVSQLRQVCEHFQTEPLLYQISMLNSSEYRALEGGQILEPVVEPNPLLGFWGSTRLLRMPDLVTNELDALSEVRETLWGKRVSLLLPLTRTEHEVNAWHVLLAKHNLARSASCRYYLHLGIPSMLWQIAKVAHLIDGIVVDLDYLTTYLFAHDIASDTLPLEPSDLEPTLLAVSKQVCGICRDQGIRMILTGSLAQNDTFLELVVKEGVSEVIVPRKALSQISERLKVLEVEQFNNV